MQFRVVEVGPMAAPGARCGLCRADDRPCWRAGRRWLCATCVACELGRVGLALRFATKTRAADADTSAA